MSQRASICPPLRYYLLLRPGVDSDPLRRLASVPSYSNIWKVPANHQSQRRASNNRLNKKYFWTLLCEKSGINVYIACNAHFLSLEAGKYYTLGLDTQHAVLCQVKKITVLKFVFLK